MTPADFPNLQIIFDWSLNELSRAAVDRKSPFRWPVLATIAHDQPQARVVVLRSFSRSERKALIFTDQRSPKVHQLGQNPSASLLFFDQRRTVQIRASGVAKLITSGPVHERAWRDLSAAARDDYSTVMAPGEPFETSTAMRPDSTHSASHFAMIEVTIDSIDWLMVSRQGHRRASFAWANEHWQQAWLTP